MDDLNNLRVLIEEAIAGHKVTIESDMTNVIYRARLQVKIEAYHDVLLLIEFLEDKNATKKTE